MTIKDYRYFILRCLQLGMTHAKIAAILGYTESSISQSLGELRKQYGVERSADLLPAIFRENADEST